MTDKLATRNQGGALAVVPEHLKKYVGVEDAENNVTTDDLIIPRLSVAQDGMSPQLKKQNELFIPGLEAGQLFNSVTNEIFESAVVIPLFFTKNYIQFAGGGVLKAVAFYDTSAEVPAGDLDWGPADEKTGKGTPPRVTEFKNRMSLILSKTGIWQPITVSFKKGEIFFADQWNSQIKFSKMEDRLPCFAHTYKVTPKLKTDGSKSWYVKTVAPNGFTPAEIYNQAASWFEQLSKGGYTVDQSGIEADTVESADTSFDVEQ